MMKNQTKIQVIIVASLLALAACSPTTAAAAPTVETIARPVANTEAVDVVTVDAEGNTSVETESLNMALEPLPAADLTAAEAAALRYMREEEKLAHDVYVTLYATWGLPIFQNIANSEQTHTEAVLTLLERYGVDDPAAGNGVGVFTDVTLQGLYDQLVAQGSRSLADALKVGAAVEEIDILDLEERIAQTDNKDIRVVYENLTKGSRNHLRSFVKTLQQQTGETYTPQYLSLEAYEAIINSNIERGNGRGRS